MTRGQLRSAGIGERLRPATDPADTLVERGRPVSDYFGATMRLYLEKLVDWQQLLGLRQGEPVDVAAEVGAFRTLLETTAGLAASFEKT